MSATQEQRAPGQMTVQMQAVPSPSNSERVLRIALVRGGRVVQERTFDPPTSITIGPNLDDTFLLEDGALSASLCLIERRRGGFVLRRHPGLRGKVSQLGASQDLAERRSDLALQGMARGKLTIGESTVLFAFEPRAVRAVATHELPDAIRAGIQIDWQLTVIAAFSFLLHFGVIGSIYSDWQDPVLNDESRVASLIDAVRKLPAPVEEEQPSELVAEPDQPSTAEAKASASSQNSATPIQNASTQRRAGAAGAATQKQARRASLHAALDDFDVRMSSVLNTRGTSTDRVLNPDAKLQEDLDAASRSSARNARHGQLDTSTPEGADVHGSTSLRSAGDPRATPPADAGLEKKKSGPKADTRAPLDPVAPNPEIPDAGAVIGGLQASFRRCYQAGLSRENEAMEGSVRITLRVAPNGSVASATPSGATGSLSPTVIGCMVSRAATAQFSAPKNGAGAVLVVPISLRAQKK